MNCIALRKDVCETVLAPWNCKNSKLIQAFQDYVNFIDKKTRS